MCEQAQNAHPTSTTSLRFLPSSMTLQTRVRLKSLKTPLKRQYFLFSSKWTHPGQSQIYKQSSRNCLPRSLHPCSLLSSQFPHAKCDRHGVRVFLRFLDWPEAATTPAWRRPGQQTASLRRKDGGGGVLLGESERREGRSWEHLFFQQKWRTSEENLVHTQATRAQCRGSSSIFPNMLRMISSVTAENKLSSMLFACYSLTSHNCSALSHTTNDFAYVN